MNAHTIVRVAVPLVLFLSACSSTKVIPPIRSEFMDIPLPGGLEYVQNESAVIESETVRAARLVYSSKFEPGSLVLSIQEGLLANGWRIIRTQLVRESGTMQLYEKGEHPSNSDLGGWGVERLHLRRAERARSLPRSRTTAASTQ